MALPLFAFISCKNSDSKKLLHETGWYGWLLAYEPVTNYEGDNYEYIKVG